MPTAQQHPTNPGPDQDLVGQYALYLAGMSDQPQGLTDLHRLATPDEWSRVCGALAEAVTTPTPLKALALSYDVLGIAHQVAEREARARPTTISLPAGITFRPPTPIQQLPQRQEKSPVDLVILDRAEWDALERQAHRAVMTMRDQGRMISSATPFNGGPLETAAQDLADALAGLHPNRI